MGCCLKAFTSVFTLGFMWLEYLLWLSEKFSDVAGCVPQILVTLKLVIHREQVGFTD